MDIERWILCRRDYLRRDFEIEPSLSALFPIDYILRLEPIEIGFCG